MAIVATHYEPLWKRVKSANIRTAQGLLDQCGFYSPPIDVEALCRVLEVTLLRVMNPGWAGAVQSQERSLNHPAAAVIWVNAADAPVRQRFTIAHEIGHLMLHKTGTLFRDGPGVEIDGQEREANQFAAELLMPEHMVLTRSAAAGRHAPTLARAFNVSTEAMTWRLKALGLG